MEEPIKHLLLFEIESLKYELREANARIKELKHEIKNHYELGWRIGMKTSGQIKKTAKIRKRFAQKK